MCSSDLSLTYEAFATRCGLSKGYISMLVHNRNPKTGLPPSPRFETYKDIANGMGMTADELFRQIDDAPVDISELIDKDKNDLVPKTSEARIVSGWVDKLPKENREQVLEVFRAMFRNNPDIFKE